MATFHNIDEAELARRTVLKKLKELGEHLDTLDKRSRREREKLQREFENINAWIEEELNYYDALDGYFDDEENDYDPADEV